jgi:hypothetical protein
VTTVHIGPHELVVGLTQVDDPFDKADNMDNWSQGAAGHESNQQHDQPGPCVAQYEFVDTEAAQQNAANARWNFVRCARIGTLRRHKRRRDIKIGSELRKGNQRFPLGRTFALREGMGVDAVLAEPGTDLFDTYRPVLPSVGSDDSIHRVSGIVICSVINVSAIRQKWFHIQIQSQLSKLQG